MKLTRRKFLALQTTAAAMAAQSAACGPLADEPADDASDAEADAVGLDAAPEPVGAGAGDPASLPESPERFPLGVMAGDVTPDAAIVWTRYAGAPSERPVLRVCEMDGERVARVVYDAEVAADDDGYVHAEVDDLRPGERYRYAFLAQAPDGSAVRSAVGRFRAAVAEDSLEVVTFGGTSCTHQARAPLPALRHAAERTDLDFFLHLGDHAYCDARVDARGAPTGPAVTLAQYREKYKEAWSTPGLRALHASTGLYTTWDDHEVCNNWNPETFPAARLAAARRAFFEHRAVRRDPEAPDRIWRSFRWGRAAEVFVLDGRSERRPSTRMTPAAQYLSRAQMAWLKRSLRDSRAAFKFVANSVPIGNFPAGLWYEGDRWESYAAQRHEILDFVLAQQITGVVWLSGDFHMSSVGFLEPSGPYARMREVLMGPGGSGPNPNVAALGEPQWDYAGTDDGYTVLRADPVSALLEVTFVNLRGETVFSRRYTVA